MRVMIPALYFVGLRINMRNLLQNGFAAALALGLAAAPVTANAAIDFSGSSALLAAKVTFDVLPGSLLKVVLTNTSTNDVLAPADVLTGVFFSSGFGSLGSQSAVLTAGSTVFYDPQGQPAGGVVGGEWGYGSGLSGAPNGANSAIMSTGAFAGVSHPTFPGTDLQSPTALDGLQYGILSAGDDTATGNGGITGSGGLIKNSVTFILSGYTGQAANLQTDITRVSFQYGTNMNEPNFSPPGGGPPPNYCANGATNFPICSSQQVEVPEPMSMALLGVGMLGLGAVRMRRRRAA